MEYSEKEFFDFEKSTSILLNSVIDYLFIELKNNLYNATIIFKFPFRKDYQNLKIFMEEITAININQTKQSIGQQIHSYKFLICNENYYLSLDPDESSEELTEEDQDFFLFRKLTASL
jgi:hypothetical protein